MSIDQHTAIEREEDFDKDAEGWHLRWEAEINAARKAHEKFRIQGVKVVNKYLNDNDDNSDIITNFNLNLFHSNTKTIRSLLFGRLPVIDVSREESDPNDDLARVAAEITERILNKDVKRYSQSYPAALRHCLDDRLQPGLGQVWLRYEFDTEGEEEEERITAENVCVDYVPWDDFEWSPCKVWGDKRWVSRRVRMTRDRLIERFGENKGKRIPLTKRTGDSVGDEENTDDAAVDAWQRADVWEIWSEEHMKVFWYCKGFGEILDIKDDPLEIEGFYPCPQPMTANTTTRAFVPKSDYMMAQDLYVEIDSLEQRISLLTDAVRAVGVYDKSAGDIARMFKEGLENDLIPVDSYAAFAEKGGLKGLIEWLPINDVADVMLKLTQRRDDLIALLQQITGMNDVMRGGGATLGCPAVSATENALEAKFSSVRMQALQDEFALFATSIMQIKAAIIAKHFQPETIIKQSNMLFSPDEQYLQPAVQLIKNYEDLTWRVKVRTESVAMVDYASLKAERTEYIQGLAIFMQSAVPLIEAEPSTMPFLLEMLKWGMAGFKGSDEIEGVLDQAIDTVKKGLEQRAQQPEKPDPAAQKEQIKQQGDRQKEQAQLQLVQTKAQADMMEADQAHKQRLEEIEHETSQTLVGEEAQMEFNMEEVTHSTDEAIRLKEEEGEIQKEVIKTKPAGKSE